MKGLIQKSGYIQPGSGGEQYVQHCYPDMSGSNPQQEAVIGNIW
ncbi:MAG: hypothetical protein ACLTXL_12560 [Clostridia bacterium]